MAKHVVARVADVPEGSRLFVTVRGRSVGVFNVRGEYFALLNRCPHQGAELCRGSLLSSITASAPGEIKHDPARIMIQCPWHGWEYDIRTGQSYFDSRVRRYPVEITHGDALTLTQDESAAIDHLGALLASGRGGQRLQPGPFKAEMFPITVENDYLVLELPGGARREASES